MQEEIKKILDEDARRKQLLDVVYNPMTGEGAPLERGWLEIPDYFLPKQFVPKTMLKNKFVRRLIREGSIAKMAKSFGLPARTIEQQLLRVRLKYDFYFWAYTCCKIKNKAGGEDISFKLNRPQRRLVAEYERQRDHNGIIRVILLKARQWGGSTVTRDYIGWYQLVLKKGLNSLTVGHVKDASTEVESMFDRLIEAYPLDLLYELGETIPQNAKRVEGVGATQNIRRIPSRNSNIKIGTAEKPDSARGGDSALVHCTEVAFWRKTEGRSPEEIVRSATSGATYRKDTMIVYESTANGTGNFFQVEYDDAKNGRSQFKAFFVPWDEIELYSIPVPENERETFARSLWGNRFNTNAPDTRHTSGAYLWKQWERGVTLDNINWYITERTKFNDDADMMAEFPSDDVEAFKHSGARVFDEYKVDSMRPTCRPPKVIGEVYADGDEGKTAMQNVRFKDDKQGNLWIWDMPEYLEEKVSDRYLTVVDIGGRGNKADWSVIVVFDRYWMMDNDKPSVVAQWYGHIDMDLLAWKAAQIATFYDNSLLVIESNTLETHDKERDVDGDQSSFILNQLHDVYPNLYARQQSDDEIKQGQPKRYGFHTNVATKPKIISTLVKVVRENLYVERDGRCLDEYLTYEKKQNGAFGAILGKHDDLLMTRAIGLHICFYEMDYPRIIDNNTRKVRAKEIVSAATI